MKKIFELSCLLLMVVEKAYSLKAGVRFSIISSFEFAEYELELTQSCHMYLPV